MLAGRSQLTAGSHRTWRFCAQSHGGPATCSRAFTVANSVSGLVGVCDGVLSASLGWSAMDQYETAYANRYVGPEFRKVIR